MIIDEEVVTRSGRVVNYVKYGRNERERRDNDIIWEAGDILLCRGRRESIPGASPPASMLVEAPS